MKSRTSYFNGTVLKKDLTRFAPVWALYGVFLLLCLTLLFDEEPGRMARSLMDLFSGMSLVNLLYAGLCAALLFGDLFNSRLCNALHALPMRREGWFLTHVTAGLLFCLIPCGLVAALCARLKPDAVIAIDALASRSVGRLASTVQLSDTGISPGSGIGNHRKTINSETVGFPVMAIGVPTVVDSATLVLDALERAGIEEYPDSLIPVLEEGMSFFVTLKDSDIAVSELSSILFEALNLFFSSIGNTNGIKGEHG